MKKEKSKIKIALMLFSMLLFIFSAAFTTSQLSNLPLSENCEECGAYGCNPTEEGDSGGTQCDDVNKDGGPAEDCDLTGTVCDGPGESFPIFN